MFEKVSSRLMGVLYCLIFYLLFSAIFLFIITLNYQAALKTLRPNFPTENILSFYVSAYFILIFIAGSVVASKQSKIKNTLVHYKNVSVID